MFGRLVTLLTALLATSFVAGPATAADGSYAPRVSTTCQVMVRSLANGSFDIRTRIVGNATDPVVGHVRLDVTRHGTTVWSKSVAYNNHSVTVHGPVVRDSNYLATATFRPSNGTYAGCSHSVAFRAGVGAEHSGGGGHHNPGGTGNGVGPSAGGLPNTGGPSIWWLLLGVSLVAAGGTTVAASKRQKVQVWK